MTRLRKLAPWVAMLLCVVFVTGLGACATTQKVVREREDNPEPELDEPRPPPGPPPS